MTSSLPDSTLNLPLKTASDWRLFLYILSPMVVTALVASQLITDSVGGLVTGLVLAILNPALQVANSAAKWRTYIYGLFGAINIAAVALGFWTAATLAPWVGISAMILNAILSAFFVPTSTRTE